MPEAKAHDSHRRHNTPKSVQPVVGILVVGKRARQSVVEKELFIPGENAGSGQDSVVNRHNGLLQSLSASFFSDNGCQCRLKILGSVHIRNAEMVASVPLIVQLPGGYVVT